MLGSLAAWMSGKRPVIDIHEDYPKAVATREWVPDALRWTLAALTRLQLLLARLIASRVIVAAPELAQQGDVMVLNVPNPESLYAVSPSAFSRRVVYVGDVTRARGAIEMVELLDAGFELLVIGRIDESTTRHVLHKASELKVSDRLHLAGRLEHASAWELASGSVCGLSLLRPEPAYRTAIPTKLWEYMAKGLPPVVSDLPGQACLVSQIDSDLVCDSLEAVAAIILELSRNETRRREIVASGRRLVEKAWADNRPDLALQSVVAP
jgi:hypothetical protein